MQQLNSFCHKYLPKHFASKFHECKLKDYFFDYKNEGNVYELTAKNLQLLDILFTANPRLEAPKIIEKYFIFSMVEFKIYRKEIEQIASELEEECQARKTTRKILKSMELIDRMCFQIFMRLSYFYFETKLLKYQNEKAKKDADLKKKDYFDEIYAFFNHVKFLTMTEEESFSITSFTEHCINILLNFNPNSKFFSFVHQIMNECQISSVHRERINQKIDQINKKSLINKLNLQKSKTPSKKENSSTESSILEPKNQNVPQPTNLKQNEKTPAKRASPHKSERKTHETSQKKEYNDNKKQEEPNTLNALKKTLQLQKNKSFKERTLYSRKTYIMPKKATNIDQTSSAGSNQNNNNQDLFLIDFNRSYSSRYLDFRNDDQDEDYLVGATPKPKKKVKIEKTYTGTFDENGNFVPGL